MADDDKTRLPEDSNGSNALSPGQSFGQYRVIRLLGRGGMGEVYEVEHPVLRKRYALKLVNREIMQRPDAVQRFQREAQVMASFQHPNIVAVDDFGETDERTWLRMELVGGLRAETGLSAVALGAKEEDLSGEDGESSLADLLKGEPLPEELVVDLLKQILEGLSYAHEQGVVHRDLKPSNILLASASENLSVSLAQLSGSKKIIPKITDFGLVRLAGEQWLQSQVQLTVARSMAQPADPDATQLESDDSGSAGTSTQALLGTFEFMAPEQKKGKEADKRADLYAIGLIAFRMLTGEESPGMETASQLVPGLDPAWDAWLIQALKSRPEARFESAAAMAAAMPGEMKDEGGGMKDEGGGMKDEGFSSQSVEGASAGTSSKPSKASEGPVFPAASDAGGSGSGGKRWLWMVVVLLLVLIVGASVYYFAVVAPEGGRQAAKPEEEAVAAATTRTTDQEEKTAGAERTRNEREKAAASAEALLGPESGRDWTVDLGGGERMKLKWIAPGSFQMGSPGGESGRDDDERQHRVTLSQGYWLGEHEVTQGEWQSLMGSNPSRFKGSSLPVEQVSWEDAMEFCRKLTARERAAGRLPGGMAYTLPTEAQWEYAARAGTTGAYAGDLDAMGWYDKNSGNKTHPVGQKRANAWGLYDMHGNVWEWCLDWYGDYPSGSVVDPRGASSGADRVNRGGGWRYTARYCRSANRTWNSPGFTWGYLGFRLALSSVP